MEAAAREALMRRRHALLHGEDGIHTLSASERAELRRVADALARIRRGDYGRCVRCGVVIQGERLERAPWTSTCTGCAGTR
jgi:RNA polymerase-binding transcription factor DksA